MKRKIYITAILVSVMTLGYAAFSLIFTQQSISNRKGQQVLNTITAKQESVSDSFPVELKNDLRKINLAHAALDNIKITNHYTQTTKNIDHTETIEENDFYLYRKGSKVYCDAGSVKRVQDEKYNVLINDDMRMILVFDPDKSLGWYMKEALKSFNPDSSLLLADKAKKIDSEKGNTTYAIYFSIMPYSRLDISFNDATSLLNSITYYYDNFDPEDDVQQQTMTILMSYEKLDKNTAALFDTKKFFTTKKDVMTATASFSGYGVFNNMKK